jgi:hypothetical protein
MSTITIVSGGQCGAERAALDWAFNNGVEHDGWCPKGRRAEDGSIPKEYHLREAPSTRTAQEVEWNVWDADGTVIFSMAEELTEDCRVSTNFAHKHGMPVLHLSAASERPAAQLRSFIEDNSIRVLNVTGVRESSEPGIAQLVEDVLMHAFSAKVLVQEPRTWQDGSLKPSGSNRLGSLASPPPSEPEPGTSDDSPFEHLWLCLYRAWEGSVEHAAALEEFAALVPASADPDPDLVHLRAAWGWMVRGNYAKATAEVEQVSETMRVHPATLFMSCSANMSARNWEMAARTAQEHSRVAPQSSYGWLCHVVCLDKMGRTKEAYDMTLPLLEKLPHEFFVPYNLACFACRLGNREDAWNWVQRAFPLASLAKFKAWALSDADLEPLRDQIAELCTTRLI